MIVELDCVFGFHVNIKLLKNVNVLPFFVMRKTTILLRTVLPGRWLSGSC